MLGLILISTLKFKKEVLKFLKLEDLLLLLLQEMQLLLILETGYTEAKTGDLWPFILMDLMEFLKDLFILSLLPLIMENMKSYKD